MTVQQLPKASECSTYQSRLYSKSVSPLEVIRVCWILALTKYLHSPLVSTEPMIFHQCVNHRSQCVCMFSHWRCVYVWHEGPSKHKNSALLAKSQAAVIEVTLFLHNQRCGLCEYFLFRNSIAFFSVSWRHKEAAMAETDLMCCIASKK